MPKVIVAAGTEDSNHKWVEAFRKRNPSWTLLAWNAHSDCQGADYAVVWQPSLALFQVETSLKAVFNLGAGVDALRLSDFPEQLPIYRLEDAGMAYQMAEYAVYGVLQATQRFVPYEQAKVAKQWQKQAPIYREQYPIGVMGMGVIGQHVVNALLALGYPLHVWTRTPRQIDGVQTYSGKSELSQFLSHTRILINVLPLTDDTQGILNQHTLDQLLPDAYLINMARGGHVVDDDLLMALNDKKLMGALLDAFTVEPLPSTHPFWSHPDVYVTPHISGMTMIPETVNQVSEKINALSRNQSISGLVKRDLGY